VAYGMNKAVVTRPAISELVQGLLYHLNRRAPFLLAPMRVASGALARGIHSKAIENASCKATIIGQAHFHSTVLRPLQAGDVEAFEDFIASQSEGHFEFFRPHKFDRAGLRRHLKSLQFLSYGIFEDSSMIAYGLIRITPTRAAYIGTMVAESHAGRGVGKLMARYLYWQTAQMGLDAFLTISDENPASLRSHSPDRTLQKVQSLGTKGYALYKASRVEADNAPPTLTYTAAPPSPVGNPHG
jgi:hypothetical protein